jgi:hypothetical protein
MFTPRLSPDLNTDEREEARDAADPLPKGAAAMPFAEGTLDELYRETEAPDLRLARSPTGHMLLHARARIADLPRRGQVHLIQAPGDSV